MSALITVNGTDGLIFSPTEILHDPRRGMSFRQHVSAPKNQLALLRLMRQMQALGASGTLHFAQDDPTYEYELPGIPSNLTNLIPELFFDDWQLLSNESTDSIWRNQIILGQINYNDRTVLARMERKSFTSKEAVAELNLDPLFSGTTFVVPTGAVSKQLGKEIDKNQTEYEAPVHVLIHTTVCSPTKLYNVARSNVMKIYTPAQLLTEVSSGWTYNLPDRLYSEIASIPVETAPDDESAYYQWGWLKKITRTVTTSNFMMEVGTEYVLGLWSTLRYGLAT